MCRLLAFLFPIFLFAQQPQVGTVSGGVADKTGASVAGAKVRLSDRETITDASGQFSFDNVTPGEFQLTITAQGFAQQQLKVTVRPGEQVKMPQIVLELGRLTTDVTVNSKQTEIAEAQIKEEETQRLVGIIPNYYASYDHNAVPLDTKQKFELGRKFTLDPYSFLVTGAIAGVQQARNDYKGYGQGFEGYAKRYGASYGDFFIGTMISDVLLASAFKQDPRYFVKGDGSVGSRVWYATFAAVRCKGDNGHWQLKYADFIGDLASAGISNAYYPKADRNGAATTFQNFAIGIGGRVAGNMFQEFLSKKITPKKK